MGNRESEERLGRDTPAGRRHPFQSMMITVLLTDFVNLPFPIPHSRFPAPK